MSLRGFIECDTCGERMRWPMTYAQYGVAYRENALREHGWKESREGNTPRHECSGCVALRAKHIPKTVIE